LPTILDLRVRAEVKRRQARGLKADYSSVVAAALVEHLDAYQQQLEEVPRLVAEELMTDLERADRARQAKKGQGNTSRAPHK